MSNAQIDNVCVYVYCLLLRLEHLIFVFFLIKILDCIISYFILYSKYVFIL